MYSLYHHLSYWAERTPEQPCIVEVESGQTLTYRQCHQAVQALCQRFGKQPRTIFSLLPGGIPSALTWLSALVGGNTLIPLAPDATPGEIVKAVSMFPPDLALVAQHDASRDAALAHAQIIPLATYEYWSRPSTRSQGAGLSEQEGRVCIMTSGSTGEPKGVVLSERQITWTAEQVRTIHELTPADRGLTTLPFFHINAPVVSLCASILAGSTVVVAGRFSRSRFWHWIEQYRVTWCSIVPTIVAILLRTTPPASIPRSVRFMRTGSAPLPAAHLQAFEKTYGIPLIETYGLSEAASMVVANPLPPQQHKPGSAGRAIGVALRICRPLAESTEKGWHDVAPGEPGEVCIQGPGVIRSYYGDAEQKAFRAGWFRTGDLGYLDEDGYLFLIGRLRQVINRGGENIAPREIEEVLQNHPAINEAVAVGRPDPIYGEQVIAFVTPRQDWDERLAEEVRTYAAHHLSAYKVPVDLIALDELPKNHVGKIDRLKLKTWGEEKSRVHSYALS
ncbi:MAG TPA: AMP-binding protein [Ktedonobacteraceae bacterium]|nr:AMP-binding protein [Ktedonobacteraceae bacterium]